MTKKALLCGVNKYQIPGADLRGCVNDVEEMAAVLMDLYRFEEADITILTDAQATTAGIQLGLQDLVADAASGDVLYFHFSGHGSNVPDTNGDEADERDEILCPHDLDWAAPLLDDWVRTQLNHIPEGVSLTFVSDCCHSGTITRAIMAPDITTTRERYLPCPLDLWAAESNRELRGEFPRGRRPRESAAASTDIKDVDLTEMLLTGCRADQTSADAFLDGDFYGALSHALIASLRDADGDITYRNLHTQVLERLHDGGFRQTPQLEGREARFDQTFLAPFG